MELGCSAIEAHLNPAAEASCGRFFRRRGFEAVGTLRSPVGVLDPMDELVQPGALMSEDVHMVKVLKPALRETVPDTLDAKRQTAALRYGS